MTIDTMDLELVVTPGLGNTTYLLAADGEAVVVDPPRDAWRVSAAAKARGWRLTHVVETHVHNDYLSGALELRAAERVEIVAPARGRYAFPHRGVDDGDELRVGGLRLVARATPGHTPEHLAWDVLPDGATTPTAVADRGQPHGRQRRPHRPAGRRVHRGPDRRPVPLPSGARRAAR